jgi:gliding motility-associated-like protein
MRARLAVFFIICFLALAGGLALSFNHLPLPAEKVSANKPDVFDCPVLNDKNIVITPSDCDVNNGSIVGMQGTGTGTLVFTWYNVNGVIVGNQADLTGVPAGLYRVTLRDDSKCPAVTLNYTIGQNNPVRIDNTNTIISPPTCNAVDGSITNITVNNAVNYQWTDINNTTIATGKDLLNVGPGTYVLTASNAKGCIAQSRYTLSAGSSAPILTAINTTNSDCKATGKVTFTFNMQPTDPFFTYTITDKNANIISSGSVAYTPTDSTRVTADALPAGTYTLTTISPGRCFTKLATFTIGQDVYAIDLSKVVIHTDICGQSIGTIIAYVKGGPPPPTKQAPPGTGVFWYDSYGKRMPQGSLFLAGVPSGTYKLTVVNLDFCSASATFFIPDSISSASKPDVKDVKICLPGKITLSAQNRDYNARYRLYDSAHNLVDTNRTGFFIRTVSTTSIFYMVSVNGICESPAAKVTVTVEDPGVTVPNTFTPNNDGINDTWGVGGLDQYPGTEVSVFNRSGYRVYHSIDYSTPFDGRINGADLPSGTYYYIIDTKKPGCAGGITGSLTIIR